MIRVEINRGSNPKSSLLNAVPVHFVPQISPFSFGFRLIGFDCSELKKAEKQSIGERGKSHLPAMDEVKLWRDKRERDMYDSFADLYAIIKTTEKLEKAYVRDLVPSAEYEAECLKLIAQFRTLHSALRGVVPSLDRFAEAYRLDAPAAINRLFVSGVPATVEHRAAAASSGSLSASTAAVAECVQHFITAMDSVKLNMVAVDQVHPLLSDLSTSLAKLGNGLLPPDFEGRTKVRDWLAQLAKMGAAEELTEQQARQLNFDLESSYSAFMAALPNAGS